MKIGDYETHPAADVLPLIDGESFDALVESIRTNGLEDDIVLIREAKSQPRILDGRNRYRACLAAHVKPRFEYYDGKDPCGFVAAKNLDRRHLTPSQRAYFAEQLAAIRHGGDRKSKLPIGSLNRGEAAKKLGASERQMARARVVIDHGAPIVRKAVEEGRMPVDVAAELAAKPKAEQKAIAEKVLKGGGEVRAGKVRALVRQNERRETVRKINSGLVAPMPLGPFGLIVVDFPWHYENSDGHEGSRGHVTYPTMELGEILAFCRNELAPRAADNCIGGFWFTNFFIFHMREVLEAARFEHRTVITWAKNKAGTGGWPRGKTEHLVIASRGKPAHTLNELTTLLEAPVREHSRKPDIAYDMLADNCAGPRLEMFAQEQREGWAGWGAESKKFTEAA
jgi:N6-adenosine-specific RNA methylase IME4